MDASLTDAAIERVLRATGDSELEELNAFVLALRERSLHVDPKVRVGHVALASAAAREAAGQTQLPAARGALKRRRRLALASLTSGLSLKVLLGAAALAAVGTGAAVTGLLPEPTQQALDEFIDPRPVISIPAELPDEPTGPTEVPGSHPEPADSHEPPPAADHGDEVSERAQEHHPVDCQTAWELAVLAAERAGARPSAPACATGAGAEPGPADAVPGNESTAGDGKAKSPPDTELPGPAEEVPAPPTGTEPGPPHSVPDRPALPRR